MQCLALILALVHVTSGQLVWKRIHAGNETLAPPARRDAGLGYDVTRNRLVLYGGRDADGRPFDDTWIFDITSGMAGHCRKRRRYLKNLFIFYSSVLCCEFAFALFLVTMISHVILIVVAYA